MNFAILFLEKEITRKFLFHFSLWKISENIMQMSRLMKCLKG